MNIQIVTASLNYVEDCIGILQDSEVGNVYFSDRAKAGAMLTNAIQEKSVYAALDVTGKCVGFMHYMPKGVFGMYPYLHIIVVREEYRGLGIGKQLVKYFEENASSHFPTKYFLTVDDFNPRAKKLYERLGYQCVGSLPDFYKEGILCYLMMKEMKPMV